MKLTDYLMQFAIAQQLSGGGFQVRLQRATGRGAECFTVLPTRTAHPDHVEALTNARALIEANPGPYLTALRLTA